MKPAAPVVMWAPIARSQRGEWIHNHCIRRTRAEARQAWLSLWLPEYHDQALKRVRFARVIVSLEPQP